MFTGIDHTTGVVGGTNYVYAEGFYYQPASNGYVVVAERIGATVAILPPGATTYFHLAGVITSKRLLLFK